jgi:hypothetical protein
MKIHCLAFGTRVPLPWQKLPKPNTGECWPLPNHVQSTRPRFDLYKSHDPFQFIPVAAAAAATTVITVTVTAIIAERQLHNHDIPRE